MLILKSNINKMLNVATLVELGVDEIFCDIPNFSMYEASSYGRLRNKITKYFLTVRIDELGYHRACSYEE
jgi:hypothetical protein